LVEHTAEIEADMQRFYGIELTQAYDGRLSWRRLLNLIQQLPDDSALARKRVGPWSMNSQLLAAAIDELRVANWQRAQMGSKERIKPPKPIPRPGVEEKPKNKMTAELAERLLSRGPEV
jgi:hypothetical protein